MTEKERRDRRLEALEKSQRAAEVPSVVRLPQNAYLPGTAGQLTPEAERLVEGIVAKAAEAGAGVLVVPDEMPEAGWIEAAQAFAERQQEEARQRQLNEDNE